MESACSDFTDKSLLLICIEEEDGIDRALTVIVIGGLESRGLTKAHDNGAKKNPSVGNPTIPGLATLKRGPYSPSLFNQNIGSTLYIPQIERTITK